MNQIALRDGIRTTGFWLVVYCGALAGLHRNVEVTLAFYALAATYLGAEGFRKWLGARKDKPDA